MKQRKKIAYRFQVSDAEKKTMLRFLIQIPEVFEAFRHELKPEHFGELDLALAVIWQLVLEFHEDHGSLPTRALLETSIQTLTADAPELSDGQFDDDFEDFLDEAFKPLEEDSSAKAETCVKWTGDIVKRLLEERLVAQFKKDAGDGGRYADDLMAVIDATLHESQRIAAIGDPELDALFPDGWEKEAGIGVMPTNIPFLDDFLDGGHAPGEVYGLLGPYGSGKTMLSTMLAVEAARQAHLAVMAGSDLHEYVFLASYEAGKPELKLRMMSYAAQIPRKHLEAMGKEGLKSLSTRKALHPYEQKMFSAALNAGKTVLGERERVQKAQTWLNEHMIVFEMSGRDKKHLGAGGGYIQEIAQRIAAKLSRKGKKARAKVVLVDYVGLMAKRHLAATNGDLNSFRHLIAGVPLMAGNLIACQFRCPVWLLHQLSGESNKKSPGARYDHTEAAEARNFGENLDFAFILGAPTDQGLCQITCSKHRRTGGRNATIIQMRGDMNTFVGTSDKYMIAPNTRRIVERKSCHATGIPKTVPGIKDKPKTNGTGVGDPFGDITSNL